MLKFQEADSENDELDPITELCLALYPDQKNVLQATTETQYWLNGPDPLDYINIYANHDKECPHFHYVSLGLTDLYGDERVHKRARANNEPSGYGYELTLRIKQNTPLPKWPFKLMQGLARYTFNNGVLLDHGDHVPNVFKEVDSKIKHILVCDDPKLKPSQTKYGNVKFLQIVGCTDDELLYAQQWSASKILNLMKQFNELGGEYLLTDLNRDKSIFELNPGLKKEVNDSIKKEGSDLSFIKSKCVWKLFDESEIASTESEFKSYNKIDLYLDLKSAQVMQIILKQRLENHNSFIFNGIDGRNLILIPSHFENSDCHVNNRFSLKSNGNECQIYIGKRTLSALNKYFQSVDFNSKSVDSLPIKENFLFEQKQNDGMILNLNVISDHEIIKLYENY